MVLLRRQDNRKKGCSNTACIRNQEHYLYELSDDFCSKCKSELVLVCRKCYGPLEDRGPKYGICRHCAAEQADSRSNPLKLLHSLSDHAVDTATKVTEKVSDTVTTVRDHVSEAADKVQAGLSDASATVLEKFRSPGMRGGQKAEALIPEGAFGEDLQEGDSSSDP